MRNPLNAIGMRIVVVVLAALWGAGALMAQEQPNWCHNFLQTPEQPPKPQLPACQGPGASPGLGGTGGTSVSVGSGGTSSAPAPSNSCSLCTGSPCLVASGSFTTSATDLQITTVGFPLVVSRSYESAFAADSVIGRGWTLNLSAHVYYATYLYAAPSTYQKEADVLLPNGMRYRFVENADGSFAPPASRYDTLVKNGDGSFDLHTADGSAHYHFGASGRLESIADEFGNASTFTYDPNDRLINVADNAGSGRSLDVYYGGDGRISTISDMTGRQVNFTYAADGTLTGVTDPAGRTIQYTYATSRLGPLLSSIVDPWSRVIASATYDAQGRTATYMENGETYTYTYKYSGRADQSSKVDSVGNRWIYTYSSDGVITERQFPGGVAQQTVYNADRSIQQMTDEAGVVTSYTYGPKARLATVTKDVGGPAEVRYDYSYDAAFPSKVTSVIPKKRDPLTGNWAYDPNWQAWQYDYYAAGSVAPGALWHVKRLRNDGVTADTVATYTYNARGQLLTVSDAGGAATEYAYDPQGMLASVTRPANNDLGTRPMTQYSYDLLGRLQGIITADHQGNTPYDVFYVYDNADRVAEVRDHYSISPPPPPQPCDGEVCPPRPMPVLQFASTQYAYDRYDAVTGLVWTDVTDPNGNVTHQGYDVYGRLVQSVDALGAMTAYTYSRDRMTAITDANGNATSYAYDGLGHLTATTFPDGATETYTYTPEGLLATKRDRKLQTISYAYDHLKRLTTKTYPNSTSITYTYQGQKLTQVNDTSTSPAETHTFAYDASFRVSSNTQATRGTIAYTYTPSDAVASYAVTGGATATYAYYPDGSLNTIQWSPVAGSFKYSYRPGGAYDAIAFPNGQTRQYAYDSWNRLMSVVNTHPTAGNIASYAYAYDQEVQGSTNRLDQRVQMTATVPVQGLSGATTQYYYDEAYQLVAARGPSGVTRVWDYDAIGNRVQETIPPHSCPPKQNCVNPILTTPYTYQKIGSNAHNWQRLLSVGTSTSYTYDANGSVTSRTTDGNTVTFAWDAENRLTDIVTTPGMNAGNRYDYQGRRTRQLYVTTLENSYLYDGLNAIGQGRSSAMPTLNEQFLFGPGIDEPLAMANANGVYYYSVDALGSVTVVSDAAGAMGTHGQYGPWGELTASGGALGAQPFWYTGREVGENDMWFYRARVYEPATGRFISEDPIGRHSYDYVMNDPVIMRDPFGYEALPSIPSPSCPLTPVPDPPLAPVPGAAPWLPWIPILILTNATDAGAPGDSLDDFPAPWPQKDCDNCPGPKRKGQVTCVARCNVENFSRVKNAPPYMMGFGTAPTRKAACDAAKADAYAKIKGQSVGYYLRHCHCKCVKN